MGGRKMRNLSYKKVDGHKSGTLSDSLPELCWEKKKSVEKNVLYALLL